MPSRKVRFRAKDGVASQSFILILALGGLLSLSACGGGSTTPPPPATYTVGGTVSGLLGTGLVLDNGGYKLPISANGSFMFSVPIVNGDTYNVTAIAQPSNPVQFCVVSDGSGTVSANVTSVEVTCATAYTVGGTVSGLTSALPESLILQDNGGDNLPINANGSFTFVTPVPEGGSYNVTIVAQPANRICAVSGGSGTANGNVTSAQVACISNETVLHTFGSTPDGGFPVANLVFDGSGNLYGTTVQGGAYGNGTVFRLTPNGGKWIETLVYSFCLQSLCADGSNPYSSLVLDAAGNLYGTSFQGGAYDYGVVFELTPHPNGTWTETVLHSFGDGADGTSPLAGLIFDNVGNLYGTTEAGGTGSACPEGCGTVFELSHLPNGQWTENILYNFCSETDCADGVAPAGVLILDAGNLYGTAEFGGSNQNGTVFQLIPDGNGQWTETVLYTFQGGGADGSNPFAGVIQDKSGNLYGTTEFGDVTSASANNGIIFELTREQGGQWTEKILHVFCSDQIYCSDGSQPLAGLVFDKTGNLYGTTFGGGVPNEGVVFKLTPGQDGAWTETPLYNFEGGSDGLNPHAGVILDPAGNLYGVASGVAQGNGVVFEMTP